MDVVISFLLFIEQVLETQAVNPEVVYYCEIWLMGNNGYPYLETWLLIYWQLTGTAVLPFSAPDITTAADHKRHSPQRYTEISPDR